MNISASVPEESVASEKAKPYEPECMFPLSAFPTKDYPEESEHVQFPLPISKVHAGDEQVEI